MKNLILKTTISVTLLCLGVAVSPVQAATGVGKAIISIGKVFSTNKAGVESKLKRRGKVFEGDTIKVGKKSRLQLRFVDNQLVVLKANTVFRIDEYKFKDKNDQNKSAALSLLKGGMRSVTGLIGKSARDKYKVKTPVATMGVRGTHYVLQLCNGDCGEGVQGIVGTVLEGQVEMVNDTGSQLFGTDQFFNVPSMDQSPTTITNPPASLVSRSETSSGDGGDSGDGSNGDGTEGGDTTLAGDDTPPPPPPGDDAPPPPPPPGDGGGFTSGEQDTVTTTTGTVNTTTTTTMTMTPPPPSFIPGTLAPPFSALVIAGRTTEIDGSGGIAGVQPINALIGLATVGGVGNQPVFASISDMMGSVDYDVLSGGVATEQGGMAGPPFSVNWGRWASTDVVLNDNGVLTGLDPDVGLAFAYSPDTTDATILPFFVGSATYNLSNGPSIRDESGGVVSGSLSVTVDFDAGMMGEGAITAFNGTLMGSGRTYGVTLDSTTSLLVLLDGGDFAISSTCSNCGAITNLTGNAGGVFVGSNAEGLIGYFGLNSADGTIGVSGVGVGVGVGSFGPGM